MVMVFGKVTECHQGEDWTPSGGWNRAICREIEREVARGCGSPSWQLVNRDSGDGDCLV